MQKESKRVNNDFYDQLGSDWYNRYDHPIALLRKENTTRNPWIAKTLNDHQINTGKILDIGCGAGLLTMYLKNTGQNVTGIDLSKQSIEEAKKNDSTNSITYLEASAEKLPFDDESFDAVCMMDLLEHVDDYKQVIKEASRVLKKNGLLFFHTFNRNLLSRFVIIKGVEWFVKNTPQDMHVYEKFIKPKELIKALHEEGLNVTTIQGLVPNIFSKSMLKLLLKKTIDENFSFRFCKNTLTGYVGFAKKT